jgi:hypothetical protein
MIDDQEPTSEPDTPTPITDNPPTSTYPQQPSSTGPVNGHEIGSSEIGPEEVGSCAVVLVAPGFASHEFAGAQQRGIDVSSVCCRVQFYDHIGTAVSETFGLVERDAELTMKRAGRLQRQRFEQIPEQLMELSHDREASDICFAVRGALRQSCPAKVTWATFFPHRSSHKRCNPENPVS